MWTSSFHGEPGAEEDGDAGIPRDYDFRNSGDLIFNARGTTDNGLIYGARIDPNWPFTISYFKFAATSGRSVILLPPIATRRAMRYARLVEVIARELKGERTYGSHTPRITVRP